MNIPLSLTALRLVLAVAIGALLVSGAVPFGVTIAAVAFVVAAATDFVDGRLARRWNQTTPLGAFIDPLADKLLVYIAFIFLTVAGAYPVWLLLILFVRDMSVDGLRAFSVGRGTSMPANLPGKWKSFLQMGSIALLLVLGSIAELQRATAWGNMNLSWILSSTPYQTAYVVTVWLMVASAAVGFVSMAQYFAEHLALFRRTPTAAPAKKPRSPSRS